MLAKGDGPTHGVVQRLVDFLSLRDGKVFGLLHPALLGLHAGKRLLTVTENEGLGNDKFKGQMKKTIQNALNISYFWSRTVNFLVLHNT